METKDIISALLAFLLGLLAKFAYDVWLERRQKQVLTFTKKTLSSFSMSMLNENLRERTQIMFEKNPVQSVQLVSVTVENSGSRAVKNQAFTVRFSDSARILGGPKDLSSSEDLRFIQNERVPGQENAHRFTIQLLQKGHRLSWEFAVINNSEGRFLIEPGIATTGGELTNVDLDVSSVITSSRAQLDLFSQFKQIAIITIWLIILGIGRGMIIASLGTLGEVTGLIFGAAQIFLLMFLLRDIANLITLMVENFKAAGEGPTPALMNISAGGDITVSGDLVGRDKSSVTNATLPQSAGEFPKVIEGSATSANELPSGAEFQ